MEKLIDDLSILKIYKNRQAVLNYYLDEDFLSRRDGLHFDSISIKDEALLFERNNCILIKIALKDFPDWSKDDQFPNYYILRNGTSRLEIYFPH